MYVSGRMHRHRHLYLYSYVYICMFIAEDMTASTHIHLVSKSRIVKICFDSAQSVFHKHITLHPGAFML